MHTAYLLLFTGTALTLAWQDWKTTYVSYMGLLWLTALGLAAVFIDPYTIFWMDYLMGGLIAGATGLAVSFLLSHALGKPAFGEADIWMLSAIGFVIGIQWTPILFGASSLLGLALFPFSKRQDVEGKSGTIMPFLPIIAFIGTVLIWARATGLLPERFL